MSKKVNVCACGVRSCSMGAAYGDGVSAVNRKRCRKLMLKLRRSEKKSAKAVAIRDELRQASQI